MAASHTHRALNIPYLQNERADFDDFGVELYVLRGAETIYTGHNLIRGHIYMFKWDEKSNCH